MSVVTVLPEACKDLKTNITPTRSIKSMESIYSMAAVSSKFSVLSRRKINQKSSRVDRNPTLVPAVSEIKQRVMSARMLRVKQLQNQIGEAHHRISELTVENRLLKSLHKRQDSALSKYENSSAELPQLLHSHAEELRMWQARCRNLQRQNKELQTKLKQKEQILLSISDQNKQLMQLNKDKNLQERASLQDRVRVLEQRCMDKENEIKLLARRLQLESKAFKSNLTMEQQKYRDLVHKIEMSDFLVDSKKSYPKSKSLYNNKSSLNRLTSKSAVNISNINGDKEFVSPTTMTALTTCSDDSITKKNDENIKQNTLCINNSHVKIDNINNDYCNRDEINLTKNCIDKSDEYKNGSITTSYHDENDEEITRVKNGMIRARQQNSNNNKTMSSKVITKLSPLHTEDFKKTIVVENKNERKSISNDSELSDDDDFEFFSNHDGTKTPHNNSRELLDHKMHINELEEKMKQNSLDDNKSNEIAHQCSSFLPKTSHSSSSSQDDITLRNEEDISHYSFDHHTFNDRGDNELITIQREIRDSTLHRESILDEYCETIYDDDKTSHYSENTITRIRRLEFANRGAATNNSYNESSYSRSTPSKNKSPYQIDDYVKSNGHTATGQFKSKEVNGKPHKLDEKKKNRLLAILKNIDGTGNN